MRRVMVVEDEADIRHAVAEGLQLEGKIPSTALAVLLSAQSARATPSTTYWAPSTTYVQPFLVPHVTYGTYFWKGTVAGQAARRSTPSMSASPWASSRSRS